MYCSLYREKVAVFFRLVMFICINSTNDSHNTLELISTTHWEYYHASWKKYMGL
jgi:hypothetical protein